MYLSNLDIFNYLIMQIIFIFHAYLLSHKATQISLVSIWRELMVKDLNIFNVIRYKHLYYSYWYLIEINYERAT